MSREQEDAQASSDTTPAVGTGQDDVVAQDVEEVGPELLSGVRVPKRTRKADVPEVGPELRGPVY